MQQLPASAAWQLLQAGLRHHFETLMITPFIDLFD